jgi:hypothetical protein
MISVRLFHFILSSFVFSYYNISLIRLQNYNIIYSDYIHFILSSFVFSYYNISLKITELLYFTSNIIIFSYYNIYFCIVADAWSQIFLHLGFGKSLCKCSHVSKFWNGKFWLMILIIDAE